VCNFFIDFLVQNLKMRLKTLILSDSQIEFGTRQGVKKPFFKM